MSNTFLSLKRLHGVDLEMIDILESCADNTTGKPFKCKHYHKKTHETPSSLNHC